MRSILIGLALWWGWVVALPAHAVDPGVRYERIAGWDGTALGAVVITPQGQGDGPFPLVVMPSSWAVPNLEYVGRGKVLARQGYVVVSYTSRGFWDSEGRIDIAGAATVEDVSAVIDWALANTPSDPARIGASGISYGAGVSLLAAARDPRIRAVAALSGWADLEASLYANETFSKQGGALLVVAGTATGRPGPELAAATRLILAGRGDDAVQGLLPLIPERGAAGELAALAESRPAILLVNAYNDSLFPPGQMVDFHEALEGAKRLVMVHGDHATAELPGALGLPNLAYDEVGRWFDRHLRGHDDGLDAEPPVRLYSQRGNVAAYADWEAVRATEVMHHLGAPRGLLRPTGAMGSTVAPAWSHRIVTGLPTLAHSGTVMISGFMQGLGVAPYSWIPGVSRLAAGVWEGAPAWHARTVAGMPHLRIEVVPEQADTSLFAYLYSVDGLGNGALISHKPYSLRGATPGRAQMVEMRLEATHWEMPPGHRLVLVIDTVDPRYGGVSPLVGGVRIGSPAQLSIPMR